MTGPGEKRIKRALSDEEELTDDDLDSIVGGAGSQGGVEPRDGAVESWSEPVHDYSRSIPAGDDEPERVKPGGKDSKDRKP